MIDLNLLNKYYQDGLLVKQTHPDLPLTIWNYSRTTEYERLWDDVTLLCRGLVTDDNGNIVGRPMKKFFNLEENKHKATKDFEVFDKLDGSLIMAFEYDGKWIICSKGSFISDQAIAAEKLFHKLKYNEYLGNEGCTHIFEYLSEWNRIVVRYDEERLVLLTMISNDSGNEINVQPLASNFFQKEVGFLDVVKKYDGIEDYSVLKKMIPNNAEGFIVKFSNGDRCKIKGEEYLRLHKLMTNVSTTSVWEHLVNGVTMEEILHDVPDEFFDVIKEYQEELEQKYWSLSDNVISLFKEYYVEGMTAKEFAEKINHIPQPYKGLLFCQFNLKFDGYSETIWNHLRPEFRKL
jgi:T4 RnlA family RNA ligase